MSNLTNGAISGIILGLKTINPNNPGRKMPQIMPYTPPIELRSRQAATATSTAAPVVAGKLPPKKDIQNKNDAYDDLQRGLKNLDGILRKEKSKKINFEAVADAIKADFPDSLTNRFFTIVNMATPESVREQEPDLKSDMIGALKYRASVKKTGDIEAADQILYKALTPRGQILADKLEFSPDEAKQMLEIYALINKLSKLAKLNAPGAIC